MLGRRSFPTSAGVPVTLALTCGLLFAGGLAAGATPALPTQEGAPQEVAVVPMVGAPEAALPKATDSATATQTMTATATATQTQTATATKTATQTATATATATQTATVTASPTPTPSPSVAPTSSSSLAWLWWLLGILVVAGIVVGIILASTRGSARKKWDASFASLLPGFAYLADETVPALVADPMAAATIWAPVRAEVEQRRAVLQQLATSAPDEQRAQAANGVFIAAGDLRAAADVRATAAASGRVLAPNEAGGNVDLLQRRDVLHGALQRAMPYANVRQ